MAAGPSARRRFTLDQARELLPTVKRLTAEAVRESEAIAERLRHVPELHPDHQRLTSELNEVVTQWAERLRGIDVEVKGLWLVDFDNGEGYYCWCYPEDTVAHFHGYDEGFAGRVKIM